MATLMLVNPSKRKTRGKKKMATKRRTAAQKRATKRLVAFNKARRKPAKRKAPAKRKSITRVSAKTKRKPTKRLVSRRRRNTHKGYFPNPRKRMASRKKNMVANIIDKQLKPAAIQASGALMLDVGYGYLGSYIPDMLNTGMIKHATKGVVAIALGFIASNFIKGSTANELAKGAMTVTMHDAMKEALNTYAPMVPLGYYNASPVMSDQMGYYSADAGSGGLGYYSSDTGTGFEQETEVFDTADI